MFGSKSKRPQIEPAFSPKTFLSKKIPKKLMMGDSYSLLKYFPKYYNDLYLSLEDLSGAIQSKVKQFKLVKHIYGKKRGDTAYRKLHYEKIFKKLFQSSRKTLKSIPNVGGLNFPQNFALCMYFPKIKTLNLKQNQSFRNNSAPILSISRSYGHFWSGSRFVENLELRCENDSDLFVIKKIDKSAHFLSHLKKIEIHMRWVTEIATNTLIELMKSQNFLGSITHFVIGNCFTSRLDFWLLQSFLDSCPQLRSLSFSTGWKGPPSNPNPEFISKDFCLDLSSLQNLQVLKIDVNHLKAFISGIDFPPSVRRIDLEIVDHNGPENFQECFDVQENKNDIRIKDEDVRDWESFEKYKVRNNFFEKWKKLNNLKVLNLTIYPFEKVDLLRDFVLPLLRATPQLDAFSFKMYLWRMSSPGPERSFDLEMFFSEIESLKSLKNLAFSTDVFAHCVFSGLLNSQKSLCLSNLSSIEIQTVLYSDFDLKKFLNRFLCINNLQSGVTVINKNLVLRQFCVFTAQDFIRILTIVHSVPCLQNLQLDLTINFVVERLDDIYSNFTYPIYVAQNTQLRVNIYLKKFQEKEGASEQEEYFKRVFGRIEFTVNKMEKYQWLDKKLPFGSEIFRKNAKVRSNEKRDWKGPLYYFENA